MIYIIGAGAIGKALAVFLKNAGREAILVRGSVDELPGTSETIRIKLPDDSELSAEVEVRTFNSLAPLDGLIVVTTKAYGNGALAAKLRGLANKNPVILLQNGLNIERSFVKSGLAQLYRCVLFVTSQFDSDFIRVKPVASCPIGVVAGDPEKLPELVSQLDNPWFRFRTEADIQLLVWRKAITNCVFNSVCPLLDVDNGIFHRDEAALAIARRIIGECITVAAACGIMLRQEEVIETLLSISRSSDGQPISTLQDIRNKRPVEIDALNAEIVRLAIAHGLENSVPETRLLGELTTIKSLLNR